MIDNNELYLHKRILLDRYRDDLSIDNGKTKVYQIIRNLTNEVIYIGCTKKTLFYRLEAHLSDAINKIKDSGDLAHKMFRNGMKVRVFNEILTNKEDITVLLIGEYEDRRDGELIEKALIYYLHNNRFSINLTNAHSHEFLSTKVRYKN